MTALKGSSQWKQLVLSDASNQTPRRTWARAKMAEFGGSSPRNPWILDDQGQLVLHATTTARGRRREEVSEEPLKVGGSAPFPGIIWGPPSTITRETRLAAVAAATAFASTPPPGFRVVYALRDFDAQVLSGRQTTVSLIRATRHQTNSVAGAATSHHAQGPSGNNDENAVPRARYWFRGKHPLSTSSAATRLVMRSAAARGPLVVQSRRRAPAPALRPHLWSLLFMASSGAASSSSGSHKRKAKAPRLVIAATASSVSHRTYDQRRQRTTRGVVGQGAGPSSSASNSGGHQFWADDIDTNLARAAENFSYQLGDNLLESQTDDFFDDGINVVITPVARNTNSDRPLQTWYPHCDEYLQENLRHEGRGAPKTYARCAGSRCLVRECLDRECSGPADWRCVDQSCFGEVMFCERCIIAAHAQHPTHFVERWNGKNFVRDRRWLQKLGLRVQLNHPPGVVCPARQAAPHDFVLYDVTGVHEMNVDFCGCRRNNNQDPPLERRTQLLHACWWPATVGEPKTCTTFGVLRLFQILNCLGKLSAYDFLRGLEMCTNHDGLDKPLVRGHLLSL
ncbi:CxC2 domain-containing protein [Mycena venus]|uniref:CxC2 domain-containing protein n=1 Tax=Mycena venus TaxID=2733690 RepID=A0A8H6YED0_9AGAR|nr:CxC2 domain-containing protein [Mycena venus]